MAETLKDYLVGIKFNVDQAGAGKANQTVSDLDAATQRLGEVLMQAAAAFQGLIAQAKSGNNAVKETSNSMKQGSDSAKKLSQNLKSVNKEGKLSSLKQGKKHVNELDHTMRKAASTLKKYLKLAAGYLVGNGILSTFKGVMEFNEGLAKSAKELKKTVEQTRAYNLALQVMGKTAKEIEQDKSLKATFENLQQIGNSLALPEAAAGIRNIGAVKDSLMELKMVGSYALQWIYYKMQEVAAGPLAETREILGSIRKWLSGNIQNIAGGIAKAFGWIVQIINSVAKAIGKVMGFIHELPDSVKWAVGIIAALILSIKSKAFRTFGILGLILLLLDDFITYLEGGDSLFGDFWQGCIDGYNKYVKPIIDTAIKKFDEFIQKVVKAWNESSSFGDFIKRLIMGEDYVVDETTWADVGKKIWNAICDGIRGAGDFLAEIILGKEEAAKYDTNGEKWKAVGKKIWEYITYGFNEAAKALDDVFGTDNLFQSIVSAFQTILETIAHLVEKAEELGILKEAIIAIVGAIVGLKGIQIATSVIDLVSKVSGLLGLLLKAAPVLLALGILATPTASATDDWDSLYDKEGNVTEAGKANGLPDRIEDYEAMTSEELKAKQSASEIEKLNSDRKAAIESYFFWLAKTDYTNKDEDAMRKLVAQKFKAKEEEESSLNALLDELSNIFSNGEAEQLSPDYSSVLLEKYGLFKSNESGNAVDTRSLEEQISLLGEQGEQAQSTAEDMGILNMSLEELTTLLEGDSESFASLSGSAKESMNAAAGTVRSGVNRIKASLSSLPKDITINVKTAFRSAGLTLPGYTGALSILNGKAGESATPGYVFGNIGSGDTNNEKNVNIQAPTTINVQGTNAKDIADRVNGAQYDLAARNLKMV